MATPLILTQLNGSLAYENGAAGGTGTGAGALRYRTGHTGGVQAALVEEGTTNYIRDPRVVNGTTYWTVTDAVRTAETVVVPTDPNIPTAIKVVTDASSTFEFVGVGSAAAIGGATTVRSFAASVYANIAASNHSLVTHIPLTRAGGFVNYDTSTTVVGSGAWARYSRVAATQSGDSLDYAAGLYLARSFGSARAATTYYATGAQFEEKDHATSYCDGSLGTGYAWAGTANNSNSTRAVASIEIPCVLPASVACRYSEDGTTWTFGYLTTLGALGTYGSVTHDGSDLVIASSRALWIGPVFAFADTLSAAERAVLENTTAWTFGLLDAVPLGPPLALGTQHIGPMRVGRN